MTEAGLRAAANLGKLLAVVVAQDEAGIVVFLDGLARWEVAGHYMGHRALKLIHIMPAIKSMVPSTALAKSR